MRRDDRQRIPQRRFRRSGVQIGFRAEQSVWIGLPPLKGLRPSRAEWITALPARLPGFSLVRPVSPTGRGATQRRAGGLKRGDAGLGARRHFPATGTARPGIFTFTAPRWLRLVM